MTLPHHEYPTLRVAERYAEASARFGIARDKARRDFYWFMRCGWQKKIFELATGYRFARKSSHLRNSPGARVGSVPKPGISHMADPAGVGFAISDLSVANLQDGRRPTPVFDPDPAISCLTRGCGRMYSVAEFRALESAGGTMAADPTIVIERRNCVCGARLELRTDFDGMPAMAAPPARADA